MNKLKTIGIVGAAATLLLSGTVAFAEEGQRSEGRDIFERSDSRPMLASTSRAHMDEAEREQIREEMKTRLESIREQAKERMEEHKEAREDRLSRIQDKRKQQLAEKLVVRFDHLNKTWTDHFVKILDRLDAILQKVQERADIAEESGKDVSVTTASIESAEEAIASAREAVIAQAAKTYTLDTEAVEVNTESATQDELVQELKDSFRELHSTLFNDLFELRDGPMKDARKAVQTALQTLKEASGSDDSEDEEESEESN